jgi:hypothetical protein
MLSLDYKEWTNNNATQPTGHSSLRLRLCPYCRGMGTCEAGYCNKHGIDYAVSEKSGMQKPLAKLPSKKKQRQRSPFIQASKIPLGSSNLAI